jgi:hypothetical protein
LQGRSFEGTRCHPTFITYSARCRAHPEGSTLHKDFFPLPPPCQRDHRQPKYKLGTKKVKRKPKMTNSTFWVRLKNKLSHPLVDTTLFGRIMQKQ